MAALYLYQHFGWPSFAWSDQALISVLGSVRNMQGRLLGKMESLGFELRSEAILETLTTDIIKTSLIEGENLDLKQVRSSVARHLGMTVAGMTHNTRHVDGVVDMMLDATQQYAQPLTAARLFGWHAALFPTGYSGMYKITVGDWRKDETGPMQVVSGPMGQERVHFRAPPATDVPAEMERFLTWFNKKDSIDPVIKSGMAHLWFLTIHPFDDGNGRIARAIADMQLARADATQQRFYSVTASIEQRKNSYYDLLEYSQKGSLDITAWLLWYLECLEDALFKTEERLAKVMVKARFWNAHSNTPLHARQKKMLNTLLDDFYGKLTTSKWAKMSKCSADTALRDIQDLVNKGILIKDGAGGRSTAYVLKEIELND